MRPRYVKAIGAYLPLLRFERKAAKAALGWTGLSVPAAGHRAVAGWDEDALTMAIEAGRIALRGATPDAVVFASTSAPFLERLHAGILVDALRLPQHTSATDVAGTRRCAVTALRHALAERSGDLLIASGDRRRPAPGNSLQLAWGDGAAAVLVGDEGRARLVGQATINVDMVDVYASVRRQNPYQTEERFVREEAVRTALAPAVRAALQAASLEAGDIALAAVQEPVAGCYRALATQVGLTAPNLAEIVSEQAGDLGAAHALFALALALERARPGDRILVAGFGSGCDVVILEMCSEIASGCAGEALEKGVSFGNYTRFQSLQDAIDLDWGPRSETDSKTSASVLARHARDMHGFVGGRDRHGNVQFPKTLIPVAPEAAGPETLEDVGLSDIPAKVVSITADRLNYTPDPPFHFGLVQFDNGARVQMEFRDVEGQELKVGAPVKMRFRIKSLDRKRGFWTYFWKAVPMDRPTMEKA